MSKKLFLPLLLIGTLSILLFTLKSFYHPISLASAKNVSRDKQMFIIPAKIGIPV